MSIKNIGISITNWDPIICHILAKKLDSSTLIHYECQLANVREIQSLSSFLAYLENRFMALQAARKNPLNHKTFLTHKTGQIQKLKNKIMKRANVLFALVQKRF